MRRQPADLDAFLHRLVGLERVRRHVLAVAAVDDQGFLGAQAPGGAGRVHRGVAAAVDDDAAAEQRACSPRADIAAAARPRRARAPRRAPGYRRAGATWAPIATNTASNRPVCCSARTSSTLWLSTILTPNRSMRAISAHQVGARQPVGGNAEMQHAAGDRAGLVDFDLMAEPGQMVRGGQAARPGADDQHALAGRRGGGGDRPGLGAGEVAEEALDRVDLTRQRPSGRDCSRSRTDDSRRGRESRAAGYRRPASPTPCGSRRPAPARARPGCSRRPGRRGCRAAAGPTTTGWRVRNGPVPRSSVRSTIGVRSCEEPFAMGERPPECVGSRGST